MAQNQALNTYIAAMRQTTYRLGLLREAERDAKNKLADYEISHEQMETALTNLISACAEQS